MGEAFAFALSAAFNPTLLAALMVMLLSANAKRLMFGYLLGALMTSITVGLVIVFALPEASATSTARNTLSPALDLALGLIALVIAFALGTGPHHRSEERREKRKAAKEKKGPPAGAGRSMRGQLGSPLWWGLHSACRARPISSRSTFSTSRIWRREQPSFA